MSTTIVRREFDRLSALPDSWDFNRFYHAFLLQRLPSVVDSLLDVGCGTGDFSRLVASRCGHVTAVDLSPGMIDHATQLLAPANLRFLIADVFSADLSPASFDAIVSIAALHHMNLPDALDRLASLLRPGGTLVILDLFRSSSLSDRLVSWAGTLLAPPVRLLHSGRLFRTPTVRAAWAAHEVYDRYVTLPTLRATASALLPGAQVRRHIFWRYSVTWTKAA